MAIRDSTTCLSLISLKLNGAESFEEKKVEKKTSKLSLLNNTCTCWLTLGITCCSHDILEYSSRIRIRNRKNRTLKHYEGHLSRMQKESNLT